MKMIYEPKFELTADEMLAFNKVLDILGQIYQESEAPMDADADTLLIHIRDFCENYMDNYEYM